MRAEAQAHVDRIKAATALLRRFLDWDVANVRLAELNARVEDPSLWNDPKAAQEVMRERRRLDEAISATLAIEQEMADTVELAEMAEAEGDGHAARSINGRTAKVTLMNPAKTYKSGHVEVATKAGAPSSSTDLSTLPWLQCAN